VSGIKGTLNRIIDRVNDAIDAFNGLPGPDIGHVPHLAAGTDFFQGGVALVGERGPELVYLPRGARVVPNTQTNALLAGGAAGRGAAAAGGGGPTYIFHIDARGSTMTRSEYEKTTRKTVDEASRRADVYQRTRRL
jgi:phage-related protein